jgi:hypothetical protein
MTVWRHFFLTIHSGLYILDAKGYEQTSGANPGSRATMVREPQSATQNSNVTNGRREGESKKGGNDDIMSRDGALKSQGTGAKVTKAALRNKEQLGRP